jgi:beta-glucosidase
MQNAWSHNGGYSDMPASPLYPFGFGLSYTQYQYRNLRITPELIAPAGTAEVSVDVTNTGTRAGAETVQLYLHERYTPVAIPVRSLRGFRKVELNPGETKSVTMKLTPEELQLLDENLHWIVAPGTFDVMVGKSSQEIVLTGSFNVKPTDGKSAQ